VNDVRDEEAPPSRDDRPGLPEWHPLARIFFYCGTLLFISSAASLLVLAAYLTLMEGGGTLEERFERLRTSPRADLLLGSYVLIAPVTFLWTMFFRRRIDRRDFRSLGFVRHRRVRSLLTGLAIGLIAPAAVVIPRLLAGVYATGVSAPIDAGIIQCPVLGPEAASAPILLLLFLRFLVQSSTE